MNTTSETFCERVIAAAQARPEKIAMVAPSPAGVETITFGAMLQQIRALAYRLTQEQIGFGDHVALIGENHPHWALAYLGTLLRGAIAVPLDPAATVETLTNFLDDSQAKVAFVAPSSFDKFHAVCERLGRKIPAVALTPSSTTNVEQVNNLLHTVNGFASFADWASTPVPPEFANAPLPAQANDIAGLMYTSGTTGTPKAVPITHGGIYAEAVGVQEALNISEHEVVLSLLPLFHVYSQVVNLWLATIIGAQVYYVTELSSTAIEQALHASRATALVGVPRLWYLFHKKIFDQVQVQPALVRWLFAALLRLNGWLRDGLKVNAGQWFFRRVHAGFGGRLHLAVSAGASFDADVARDFHRLGLTILQGYGLTETTGAATVTRFEDNLIGSVGQAIRGVEIRLAQPDKDGVGEVLIRGPIVTPGYYHNDAANAAAFTQDGWYRTGDLGRFDARRHLFIVGRSKDVIKLPSGKNVFPADVEAHYEHSPLVSEVCVLGVKDEAAKFARAEKLVAVVVPNFDYLKAQGIANAREWVTWELDGRGRELPEYQRVRDYVLRSEPLPRTTTRKLKRFEVQRWLENAGTPATANTRDWQRFKLNAADRALLDSPAGQIVLTAIRRQKPQAALIHPAMNLELDLGLDSLARAECSVSIEHALNANFAPEAVAAALTVGEWIALTQQHCGAAKSVEQDTILLHTSVNWHNILNAVPADLPDVKPILARKPLTIWCAWVILKVIYLCARVFCRMKVEGRDVVTTLPPPYLVCPNHQSFLDGLIVCSVYPRKLLPYIFHVGTTVYFTGRFGSWLARTFNIVPVDADTALLRALRASAAGLRAGRVLNLYPEGQRTFDGRLGEFRDGAAILATELNLPIVPVALDGMHRVWPRGSKLIRPAKVRLGFGAPIMPAEASPADASREARYQALTRLLKQRIQQMLNEQR
jgi:long-chain acyl-CoA synthetase